MKILIVQNCEIERVDLFERYLFDNNIEYDIFHPYKGGRFPAVKKYDAFIIGGTPISAYEARKYRFLVNEKNYMKKIITLRKPVLGICCGAQLLASVLGAKVTKNPVMEIGIYEVILTTSGKKDPLFKGFPAKFPVFHWHGDTFEIPNGGLLLVEGKDCKNQVFKYDNTVGFLFHLEVSCKSAAQWADAYRDELSNVAKTKKNIISECKQKAEEMKTLAHLLMSNFLNQIKGEK